MGKRDDVRLIIDQLNEINHGMLGMAQLLQQADYDRFACMLRVLALHADGDPVAGAHQHDQAAREKENETPPEAVPQVQPGPHSARSLSRGVRFLTMVR